MKIRALRSGVPLAMLLASTTCQDPDTVDPAVEPEDVDPWAGTAWAVLLQEAEKLGGRATIAPLKDDGEFQVLPADPRPAAVLTDPACSVPGDPSAGEARAFMSCMNALARVSDLPNPDMQRRYAVWIRPNRLLTWEEDEGVWRVWYRLIFDCGEGYYEAERDGVTRKR